MEIWVVNKITQDLDGTGYFYRATKVFTTEERAKRFYNTLYDILVKCANEILDEDENGVVFYEEDTIPKKTTLTIEEKVLE